MRKEEQPIVAPLVGKYGDVLAPFLCLMESELHANSGKGDRPGWLSMDRKTGLLEIFYHLAKMQKAVKDDDQAGIREYGADVANMAMMLVDICGALPSAPKNPASTIERLKGERDGAVERGTMMLNAKNDWQSRTTTAESEASALRKRVKELEDELRRSKGEDAI